MEKINLFNIKLYGELKPFEKNPLLSVARARIFYKGLNRNHTFITDEFGDKLNSSLPYTPISGIWSDEKDDFTNHGKTREEGRIYGIVPEVYNQKYEKHLDEDGIEREYSCCDVVLFTTRYKHASDILEKPLSMEIYDKSIKGEWIIADSTKAFRFDDGCFIGLQVLGEDVEPCFEGAQFYSYVKDLKSIVEELKQYTLSEGGKNQMDKRINFNLSDDDKYSLLFDKLNKNCNEEGNYTVDYSVCKVYDQYALVYACKDKKYCRAYYTKDNDSNSVELGDLVDTFVVDVTEAEYNTLKNIQSLNGGNFNDFDSKYQTLLDSESTLKTENEKLSKANKNFELTVNNGAAAISGLNTKIEELNGIITDKENKINSINTELSSLKEFKLAEQKQEKVKEIAKFSMLSPEIIEKFTAEVDNYTLEDLHSALSTEYVNENANSVFSLNDGGAQPEYKIPTDNKNEELTGAAKLIQKHRNGGK